MSSGVNKRIDILNSTFVQPTSNNQHNLQQPTTPTSMLNSTLMNNTQMGGNNSSQPHLFMNQTSMYNKNQTKGQTNLNIETLDDQESQYCLEQLISPNFQPQSALSMQKRLSKQQQASSSNNIAQRGNNNSNSSTKFQMSGNIHFFGKNQNDNSNNKYSSLFRKNSTRSSRMESPSCHQQDSIAQSISKVKNKQRNVKKIMNDSLNMITKSRNKYLNKSFQQHNSSSSATRIGQTSFGGDTTLNASGNQHLSLKKITNQRPGAETSMKKLNSTASYDILGMQRENDNLDHSYGRLGPDHYNKNSSKGGAMRSPHSFAQNWSNQNTNTLNSNNLINSHLSGGSSSINIIQSQISQKHLGSNQKMSSSDRDQMNGKHLNNLNFQSNGALTSNMSTTNKKNTFKFNFKSSLGCSTGMQNTPLGRSQYISTQNGQSCSQDITCNDSKSNHVINQQDYQIYTESSHQVSPLSSLPKRQLNFNSKGQITNNNPQLKTESSIQSNQNLNTTAPSTNISNIKNPQIIQTRNQQQQLIKQYQSQNPHEQSSSPLNQIQLQRNVRPFQYSNGIGNKDNQHTHSNQDLINQKQQFFLDNLDQNDFIDPNLFYQQQAVSTTSQHSQSMSHEVQMINGTKNKNNKYKFQVPKISKLQLQQSFHHQPTNHGCLTNNHKASQQQFLSMGENSDFSQEPTIKRSLTPSSGYYSINQLNVNQSGQTEKYHQNKSKRRQTNQNFQQLQLIDMQQQNVDHQFSIQNQTFQNINQHDDSLMMMLQQNNLNNSHIHNQPLSGGGEDISFNIDCSQAFQFTNQTLDRPMTVGDINNSVSINEIKPIKRQGTQQVPQNQRLQQKSTVKNISVASNLANKQQQLQKINNTSIPDTLVSRQIDESVGGQSENLETSRFSTTIETQIQQNTLLLTNQSTIEQNEYSSQQTSNQLQNQNTNTMNSQSQRFLKVAPNANQIKMAMLNQVNQRKIQMNESGKPHLLIQGQINATQRQFFNKAKGDKNSNENDQQSKEYIKQLKQEIQNRRDQQMRRNQELFSDQNLSTILNNSSMNTGSSANINKTKVTGNNIFILNSATKQSNQHSQQKQQTVIKIKQCKHHHNRKQSYQKRDLSADNLLYRRGQNDEISDVSSTSSRSHESSVCSNQSSQDSSPCSCKSCVRSKATSKLMRHLKQGSQASSSFLESTQQIECKECLDSKCQSRLCCQCNESERCSKLSKNNGVGSRMSKLQRNHGATSGMSRKSKQHNHKIRKDRDGRQYIKYKDNVNNQIYRIDAPNNVFFNDEIDLAQNEDNGQNQFQHRGRQLKNHTQNSGLVDCEQIQNNTQNLIPIVKRNLTPDDHLRRDQAESYILVDQKGKPRKIYIQRNVPIKVHTPGKDNNFDLQQQQQNSRTLDYDDQSQHNLNNNNTQNITIQQQQQQFSTIQNKTMNKTATQNIQSQRKKFFNGTGGQGGNGTGGDSSLICCLSTKSQRDYSKYDSTSKKSDTSNNSRGGRCLVQ